MDKMEQSPPEQTETKPTIPIAGTNGIGAPQPAPAKSTTTVEEIDIEILPVVYDIIRGVEKDPVDNTAKQRESQECSQKIIELQKRFESARKQIKQLPGIDYNKEEQLQKLELLKNQLILKQQLIKKYLANNEKLVERLAESYPMRRTAQLLVSLFYRSKSLAEEHNLTQLTPEKFKSFMRAFRDNMKQEIEGAKEELKKRKP